MSHRTHYYNVHSLLHIRSAQRLPELAHFRTETPLASPDIDVRIAYDLTSERRPTSICYAEAAGRYGFSVVINREEAGTEVVVSPLVGLSPHVLYTNVVEPLLRWALVRKGYALMHGACLAFGERALFITARTDTGKTTTILHTLRRNVSACRFLSDDMTIFSRDGQVFNFPKPLTISQHTLQAVGGSSLSLRERLFLQVQSRLHSREGRRAGMWLSRKEMPAATLNALVQWLIPPPKFMVERLVPGVRLARRARLEHIVLIERGPKAEATLSDEEKVGILIANAEDAYGFPPYPMLAQQLSHWRGRGLHDAERAVVVSATRGVSASHLRSEHYDWYKRLPQLLASGQRTFDPRSVVGASVPAAASTATD